MLNHISPRNEAASGDSAAGNGIDLADDPARAIDQTHDRSCAPPLKHDHFYDATILARKAAVRCVRSLLRSVCSAAYYFDAFLGG